ncbi:MAG: 1-acyl-sn-glycerol-3-phosphate acyltransferase [Hyphomonadaceae bacterium]
MSHATQILIDRASARPAASSGLVSDIVRWISAVYLKLGGWRIEGDWPGLDKAVLVAAPHTSNWDGINMLATAGFYRVKLRWMGKKSLTQGPFGWLIKALGCVPIDRSASHDVVNTMSELFAQAPRMVLAVPPEGTRSAVREWKSGFYHIAVGARVPIILSVLDYGGKTVRLAAIVTPSGDYDADLPLIRAHYRDAIGKRAEKFVAT